MSYALITGGSKGIGYHVAKEFARRGDDLILVARSNGALRDAKHALEEHDVTVQTLSQDLSEPDSAEDLVEFCDRQGWDVDVVVNNAGFGKHANFTDTSLHVNQSMLVLNCYTPITLAHKYIKRGADVINVGSIAGYQPLPGFANYAATKAYVYSWSVALNQEVNETVLTVCPGPTKTGFAERSGAEDLDDNGMEADVVAEQIIKAYQKEVSVVINGWTNKLITAASHMLPPSWVAALVGKR
jgi:short-subunit dehydrogenase